MTTINDASKFAVSESGGLCNDAQKEAMLAPADLRLHPQAAYLLSWYRFGTNIQDRIAPGVTAIQLDIGHNSFVDLKSQGGTMGPHDDSKMALIPYSMQAANLSDDHPSNSVKRANGGDLSIPIGTSAKFSSKTSRIPGAATSFSAHIPGPSRLRQRNSAYTPSRGGNPLKMGDRDNY